MTLKQLEGRVDQLEREIARLRGGAAGPSESTQDTFGMIGDDPEFDEMVRLGREYRRQANSEGE